MLTVRMVQVGGRGGGNDCDGDGVYQTITITVTNLI